MARAQAQRRRKTARSRARRSSSSVEDLMFFPKLRRRAKWVFLFLAIAFGLGFVANHARSLHLSVMGMTLLRCVPKIFMSECESFCHHSALREVQPSKR